MNNYIKTIINGLKTWISSCIRSSRGNWEQNDSNADDYIKNRPFYSEQKMVKKVIFSSDSSSNKLTEPLIVGVTYTVTWNGVEYNCVARMYDGYVMLGNNAIYEHDNGIETDSGEPFALEAKNGKLSWYVYTREEEDFTVSISYIHEVENITTIDPKFLPDEVVMEKEFEAALGDINAILDYINGEAI